MTKEERLKRKARNLRASLRKPCPSVGEIRSSILGAVGMGCAYCQERFPISKASLDHRLPKSQGGTDVRYNLQIICARCNRRKGDFSDFDYRRILNALDLNVPDLKTIILKRLAMSGSFYGRKR